MKKLLSIILVLCLFSSGWMLSAFAEEDAMETETGVNAEVTPTTEPTPTPPQTEEAMETETEENAEVTPTTKPTPTPPQTEELTQTPSQTITPTMTAVRLQIDDKNIYEGMDKAYKDGYVPLVSGGVVTLVMPLVASGSIYGNEITVIPNLGDTNSSPIQYRNYQKTFSLADNPVNDTGEEGQPVQTISSYLVWFDFPLRSDRSNGVYPITLEVRAQGADGSAVQQSFTCYVTITDGQSTDIGVDIMPTYDVGGGISMEEEDPESKPRVLVSKYAVSAAPVQAGEGFTVTVTLKNTSDTQDVQNMLVTVSSDCANLVLKNDSNTIFVGDLGAGTTKDLELSYSSDLETPPQRYNINLAMEYDDSDAMTMTSAGSVVVEIAQTLNVELSPFYIASDVNAGETIQLSFQVMNLGRGSVYNVRVELDVPGLSPTGTAFIGNMESGTSADATMNVFVGMKEGDDRYGYTDGVVRLVYEDVSGEEYVDETPVSTNVKELVISTTDNTEKEEAQTRAIQWWLFIIAGAVVIVALVVVICLKRRKISSRVKV